MLEFANRGAGMGMRPASPSSAGGTGLRPNFVSPMRRSNPFSFKKGGKVKRGGIGKLHKGERVVPAKFSKAKSVLGGKKSKTKKLIEAAGHELKVNPPKVLAQTARKSGAKQAAKQRVAIMLSKARAAGANISKG